MATTNEKDTRTESQRVIDSSEGFMYYTFDELLDEGKVSELCLNDFTLYAVIYESAFGKYPEGSNINDDLADDTERQNHKAKGKLIDEGEAERYRRLRSKRRLKELMEMSYDELAKNDLLKELKELNPAGFEAKKIENSNS